MIVIIIVSIVILLCFANLSSIDSFVSKQREAEGLAFVKHLIGMRTGINMFEKPKNALPKVPSYQFNLNMSGKLEVSDIVGASLNGVSIGRVDLSPWHLKWYNDEKEYYRNKPLRFEEVYQFNAVGLKFKGVFCPEIDCSNLNLSYVDFKGSIVCEGNFEDACLNHTDLCGVDFNRANFKGATFHCAFYDKFTIFPSDFDIEANVKKFNMLKVGAVKTLTKYGDLKFPKSNPLIVVIRTKNRSLLSYSKYKLPEKEGELLIIDKGREFKVEGYKIVSVPVKKDDLKIVVRSVTTLSTDFKHIGWVQDKGDYEKVSNAL